MVAILQTAPLRTSKREWLNPNILGQLQQRREPDTAPGREHRRPHPVDLNGVLPGLDQASTSFVVRAMRLAVGRRSPGRCDQGDRGSVGLEGLSGSTACQNCAQNEPPPVLLEAILLKPGASALVE
jgi:hypothetical protein